MTTDAPRDREYYRTIHGFDPILDRIPLNATGTLFRYEAWFPLANDPPLAALEMQIGARVETQVGEDQPHNRIVIRGPERREAVVDCIHTMVATMPAGEALDTYGIDPEGDPATEMGGQVKRAIEHARNVDYDPAHDAAGHFIGLAVAEHFASLKMYVAGLAEVGLLNVFRIAYFGDAPGLPYGFNVALQTQLWGAIKRVAPSAIDGLLHEMLAEIIDEQPADWLLPRLGELDKKYDLVGLLNMPGGAEHVLDKLAQGGILLKNEHAAEHLRRMVNQGSILNRDAIARILAFLGEPAPADVIDHYFMAGVANMRGKVALDILAQMLPAEWQAAITIPPDAPLPPLPEFRNPSFLPVLARHPGATPGLLRLLLAVATSEGDSPLMRAIAASPQLDLFLLNEVYDTGDIEALTLTLTHPLAHKIVAYPQQFGVRVAKDPALSPWACFIFAHHPDALVRATVAGNPAAEEETLAKLCTDGDTRVLTSLVARTDLPPELWAHIAPKIRAPGQLLAVSTNPTVPPPVLASIVTAILTLEPKTLAQSPHLCKVLLHIVANEQAPEQVLARLATEGPTPVIRQAATARVHPS